MLYFSINSAAMAVAGITWSGATMNSKIQSREL